MSLLLEIVTPEKLAYRREVDFILMPTVEGELGILPGHIPILTMINPGDLAATAGGKTEHLAVDKGFVHIQGDKVSVLTEGAIDVEEIDLAAVENAQARAEKALAEARKSEMDPAEIEKLETIVRFSIAQKLAKKRRL